MDVNVNRRDSHFSRVNLTGRRVRRQVGEEEERKKGRTTAEVVVLKERKG